MVDECKDTYDYVVLVPLPWVLVGVFLVIGGSPLIIEGASSSSSPEIGTGNYKGWVPYPSDGNFGRPCKPNDARTVHLRRPR